MDFPMKGILFVSWGKKTFALFLMNFTRCSGQSKRNEVMIHLYMSFVMIRDTNLSLENLEAISSAIEEICDSRGIKRTEIVDGARLIQYLLLSFPS